MPARQQYFEILGLDAPPADRKAVKRAYSKKLKVTRPEDDPDGFMRLRNAHDTALSIIARQAEQTAWEAQNSVVQTSHESELEVEDSQPASEPSTELEPGLTYRDMLPQEAEADKPEPDAEDTSYSIGPTPSFDAPVISFEPEPPKGPPLLEELETLLSDPKNYNDRENWNQLFRKARQLDIDEYVDFEHLILDAILRFQGYHDYDNPHYDTPEKLYQKLSPSIAASLFKTMSWDQVNTQGYHRGQQVEWLARRMQVHKRGADPVPVPQASSKGSGNVWMWIFGAFILLKIIQALANA